MRPLWGASRRDSPIMREIGMKTVLAAATAPSGRGVVEQHVQDGRDQRNGGRDERAHREPLQSIAILPHRTGVAKPGRDQRAERGDRPADTALEERKGLLDDDKGQSGGQGGHVDDDHGRPASPTGQLPVGQREKEVERDRGHQQRRDGGNGALDAVRVGGLVLGQTTDRQGHRGQQRVQPDERGVHVDPRHDAIGEPGGHHAGHCPDDGESECHRVHRGQALVHVRVQPDDHDDHRDDEGEAR